MGSIIGKFKDRTDKEDRTDKGTLMMRNGASVLKELIASSHGKYNPYRIFSAQELEIATNNYEETKVIKQDSMYKLYKGFWQERLISVMKFNDRGGAYEGSINNIIYAAQMIHNHILNLIGCCLETPIPVLVFESVEYGTLCDRILGAPQPQFEPLLLKHRLKIAMDVAHSLAYLHFGFPRPIVHRDFKTSHILFNEENVAKLFDFSLSISIPEGETHITDAVMGTMGYLAPEYLSTSVFNEQSDVFGFGVFLGELLTGLRAYDPARLNEDDGDALLVDHMKQYFEEDRLNEIIDHLIMEDMSCPQKEQQLQALVRLIFECVNRSPVDRPTMVDVAKKLKQMYRSCA